MAFGKIDKQKSGRWRARYLNPETPHLPTGRRNYISAPTTFRTKTEASAWLSSVQTAIAKETWKSPESERIERDRLERLAQIELQPFGKYADRWMNERKLTPATRHSYESYLNNHLKPRWATTPLPEIFPSDVRQWATELAPGRPGARKKSLELFRTILNGAVDDELLGTNPCKRNLQNTVRASTAKAVKQYRKREPRALTMEELRIVSDNVPHYMKTLVLLSGMVGLRAGEVRALRGDDVEVKGEHLFVHISEGVTGSGKRLSYGVPKTPKSRRRVPVPPALAEEILRLAKDAGPRGLLFPGIRGKNSLIPISTYEHALARVDKKVGIGHVSPHDLRHTASSLLQMRGVSEQVVRDILGHTKTVMTQRYTHTFEEQLTAAAKAVDSLYSDGDPSGALGADVEGA